MKLKQAIVKINKRVEEIRKQIVALQSISDPAANRNAFYQYITLFPSYFAYLYQAQSDLEYILNKRKLRLKDWYARKAILVKEDHVRSRNNLKPKYYEDVTAQLKAKRELSQTDLEQYIIKKFGLIYRLQNEIIYKIEHSIILIKGLKQLLLELNQLVRTLLADIREDYKSSY